MADLTPTGSVDLTNCDREPIHKLGYIQSFGGFLALRADWTVAQCSANISAYLGVPADEVVGGALNEWFCKTTRHHLRSAVQSAMITRRNERLFGQMIAATGKQIDVSVHHNGEFVILEFEPSQGTQHKQDNFVRSLLSQFYAAPSSQALAEMVTQQLKLVTGYDRVMLYRFLPDGAGEVIAEAKDRGLEAFLGLRYPASDIPKQARALYLKNLLRVIGNVDDTVVPIIPGSGKDDDPVDLSYSTLRAVSPVHLEYLRNMGVSAALSVSVIVNGKLWGLIACHHHTPKIPSYFQRTELELFAEFFALEMGARLNSEREAEASRTREFHRRLMTTMAVDGAFIDTLEKHFPTLQEIIPCDGILAQINGQRVATGLSMQDEVLEKLIRYLNSRAAHEVTGINGLADVLTEYDTQAQSVAGVMALPISRNPRDYVLFFRAAQTQTVEWAGNPNKPVSTGPNGDRLLPRSSFALWKQTHRDQCHHWSEQNYRDAESLRVMLLEVMIRHMQERDSLLLEASRKHELLISELNHRVRNILNLVNAIILQTDQHNRSVADFVEVLTGRLVALASAHDQLTASEWREVNFRHILETEIQAYIDLESHITLSGPEITIKPEAATPVVLVIHEMFTNAAKYGALAASRDKGQVTLRWSFDKDRGLCMDWQELGGPPVKPPTREGFGMTLIRSVIPHELGGELDITFDPHGVHASMQIPARYVLVKAAPVTSEPGEEWRAKPDKVTPPLPEKALVVEDNLVIALDMQAKLKRLGIAEVAVAGNLNTARSLYNKHRHGLVIFDVHLGNETTLGLLQEIAGNQTPCLIVSGYGDELKLPASFEDIPVLSKPVAEPTLRKRIMSLFAVDKD
ncbi:GAF domain-containing protein [Alteromonas sp. ASW11-19]|uniref:histidine kinase n=1 Tax=Alteromonas salexigens TaxID=2982530 RepID=A0ABT2VM37_9ALTE|nr:HWE histidine kinase domain-containing protein [Alteromonas salexigens]MCU7553907.1 GAF domain-containing protein [Alteromonas salexigens]